MIDAEKLKQAQGTVARILGMHPCPWHYVPHDSIIYTLDANQQMIQMFDILDFCTANSIVIAHSAMPESATAQPA